jgi:hypothetical protein
MLVMNIIYAYDDLCEYLRLLEKRKERKEKLFAESRIPCSRQRDRVHCALASLPRAKSIALGEERNFNES